MEYDDANLPPLDSSPYDYVGNASTSQEDEEIHPWDTVIVIFNVLQALGAALGLLINTLLVVLVATSPNQRTVSHMYLMQRAVSEILFFTFTVYLVILGFGSLQYSFAGCVLTSIAVHVATVASLLFLMMYVIDSYLASRPQQYTLQYRRKVMKLTSAAAWFLAAVVGIPAFILTAREFKTDKCVFSPLFAHLSNLNNVISALILFVVPLVVVWVFVGLVKLLPAVPKAEEGHEDPNRRLLLALASLFTAMQGVYWIITILMAAGLYHWVSLIFLALTYYENVISPILVICMSEGLRQKVVGWLPGRKFESLPLQDV